MIGGEQKDVPGFHRHVQFQTHPALLVHLPVRRGGANDCGLFSKRGHEGVSIREHPLW